MSERRPPAELLYPGGGTFAVQEVFFTGSPVHLAFPSASTGEIPFHRHAFLEIALVVAGSGRHRTMTGVEALQAGDALVIPPLAWHAYADLQDMAWIDCCVDLSGITAELAALHGDPGLAFLLGLDRPLRLRPEADGFHHAEAALRRLHRLRCRRLRCTRADQVAALLTLLSELARVLPEQVPEAGPGRHPVLQAVLGRLETDLARPWSIDALARDAGITRTHLARLFRRHTGLSPLAWLIRRRVEQAAALLAHGGISVEDAGRAVGWSDPSHFARRFRSVFRCSPGEWRGRRGS